MTDLVLVAGLPSPEYWGAVSGAVVTGLLSGAAIGYTIWKKKKTDADIEAFRRMEEAQKGTSLKAIQDLTDHILKLTEQLQAAQRRIADADREQIDARSEVDRLQRLVYDFARDILEKKGFLIHDEPAIPPPPDG